MRHIASGPGKAKSDRAKLQQELQKENGCTNIMKTVVRFRSTV